MIQQNFSPDSHTEMKQKIIIFLTLISFAIELSSCECIGVCNPFQLLSILNSLKYEYHGPYSSGHLPITEDIQISGTIVISSAQLEIPKECLDRLDCRHLVGFSDKYGADGINVITPPDRYSPGILTLTNVRLRFRPLLIDTHPMQFNYVPVLQIMPPSDYECEDSQTRCEIDQVCYGRYQDYCQHCLALSQEECVCRDEEGIFPDGTYCEFFISGDAIVMGECQDGKCFGEGCY